jgi:hypothetical protein
MDFHQSLSVQVEKFFLYKHDNILFHYYEMIPIVSYVLAFDETMLLLSCLSCKQNLYYYHFK